MRALFILELVQNLGYPPDRLELEYHIRAPVGRKSKPKRVDIVVLNPDGSVFMLIELKAPSKFYMEADDAWEGQLFGLASHVKVGGPSYLAYGTAEHIVSEEKLKWQLEVEVADYRSHPGHEHWQQASRPIIRALPINYALPTKRALVNDPSNPLRVAISDGTLDKLATDLHNVLWGGGSIEDSRIFTLITRLLLAKLQDERSTAPGQPYAFQTLASEPFSVTIDRIDGLYQRCLQNRLNISADEASLRTVRNPEEGTDDQIRYAVEQLERYSFTKIVADERGADLLGRFYEKVIRTGAKQSKGQFFTHQNITDFCTRAVGIPGMAVERATSGGNPPLVIDPSVGSGTFLVSAMVATRQALNAYREDHASQLTDENQSALSRVLDIFPVNQWAKDHFIGHEINADVGLAAQTNMMLHGDGSTSIMIGPKQGDGLAAFADYQYTTVVATPTEVAGYEKKVVEKFDVVLTNPPFSVQYSQAERKRYAQELNSAEASKRSEDLFVERWWQLLKPDGRLCAVVPDSLLDLRSRNHGRELLLRGFRIRAVVSLPERAFYPHTSTKTSLLFATKLAHDKYQANRALKVQDIFENHPPFLAVVVENLGYERTQKREHPSDLNDLPAVLDLLNEKGIWE